MWLAGDDDDPPVPPPAFLEIHDIHVFDNYDFQVESAGGPTEVWPRPFHATFFGSMFDGDSSDGFSVQRTLVYQTFRKCAFYSSSFLSK